MRVGILTVFISCSNALLDTFSRGRLDGLIVTTWRKLSPAPHVQQDRSAPAHLASSDVPCASRERTKDVLELSLAHSAKWALIKRKMVRQDANSVQVDSAQEILSDKPATSLAPVILAITESKPARPCAVCALPDLPASETKLLFPNRFPYESRSSKLLYGSLISVEQRKYTFWPTVPRDIILLRLLVTRKKTALVRLRAIKMHSRNV